LEFRLPWPAKIAAGMLTPGKWPQSWPKPELCERKI
jgi:hypothetical protein